MAGVEFSLNRERTAAALMDRRVVVVMTRDHVKTARHLVDTMLAVHQAGFVAEATMRISHDLISEAMPELKRLRQEELDKGNTFVLGVGSITSDAELERAAKWGFDMLVGPGNMASQGTDPYAALSVLQKMGYFLAPAASTPTEFQNFLGPIYPADAIKIFPADVLGPKGIQSLLAPYARPERQIMVMPTGGVDHVTGPKYIEAISKGGFMPLLGMSSPLELVKKNKAPGDIPTIWRSIGDFIDQFLKNNEGRPFGAIDPINFGQPV
jgi:2-keto-3-deoxy-6-phosphogluconate aldolase